MTRPYPNYGHPTMATQLRPPTYIPKNSYPIFERNYLEIQRLDSYNHFSPICAKIRALQQGQDHANPISGSQVICIQSSDMISKITAPNFTQV